VPSQENLADCASRGLSATALTAHEIWWNGPSWLKNDSANWPKHDPAISTDAVITERISAEARSVSTVLQVDHISEWELPHRYSSWTRLTQITAYVRRFVANLRQRKHIQTNKKRLPIQVSKLNEAAEFWFRSIPKQIYFPKEWRALSTNTPIPSSSSLRALKVMGAGSLLRLGGRLRNAAIEYSEKCPVILPKHRISDLLIDHAHRGTLHGGISLRCAR